MPSVKAAWFADVRRAGAVGRNVFWPAPNVDSGLVAWTRREPPADHRHPRARCSRSSTRRSPSAARRCAAPSRASPAPRRPPRPRWRTPASTRWRAGESLDVEEFARIAEGLAPDDRAARAPAPHGHRARARQDQPAPRRRAAARRRLPRAARPSTRRSACTTRSPSPTPTTGRVAVDRRRPASPSTTCPLDGANIAIRAAGLLAAHHGVDARRRDRASTRASRSPAGMAGGSADAAAALVALRPAVGPATPRDEDLLALAAELGSDVPFALRRRHRARHRPRRGGRPRSTTAATYWWVVVPVRRGPVHARGLPASSTSCTPTPRADARRPPTRCWPRCAAGDPPPLGRRPAQRPRRPPALACAPTSATLHRAGRGRAGALRGLVSGSGPTCLFLVRGPRRTPREVAGALRCARARSGARRHRPGRRRPRGRTLRAEWPHGQPGQPRAGLQGVRRPPAARPTSASASARASGSASSAATATARPRCCEVIGRPRGARRAAGSRATAGCTLGYLTQGDDLDDTAHRARGGARRPRRPRVGRRRRAPARSSRCCSPGVSLDRAVDGLSGGERRRCSLAALLLGDHDLIVLDEPTNHLDVEAVAWLAAAPGRAVPSALVVVTHDRWFLDAVCQTTWEVHDGVVDAYEGGYAAFVLAKAERQRQAAASEARRQNLVRKELAWLRRGAAGADLEAEVPHRRRQRADRGRAAAARPARAAAVRDPAARQGRHRRRGRRPGPRRAHAALARHLAARARRPGRHRRRQRRRQDLGAARWSPATLAPHGGPGEAAAGRSRCST